MHANLIDVNESLPPASRTFIPGSTTGLWGRIVNGTGREDA